ncbi:hypothetical protein [Stenotrophomonas maltophilia]|uniref:hypothetical protein n=1 Tax=Stenotrophomonas maltophilia TaxID=40324 RepID=UPI000D0DAD86|nr:hypothetical protein [Stenotrophomonas maltophilia]PSM14444.1 hypothetical protein CV100_06660 [Stenotrophomonas maltophilia]
MNAIDSKSCDQYGLRELTAEQIEAVSGGKADFFGVTSSVDSTAQIVSGSCVRSSSMMPYFSFSCL